MYLDISKSKYNNKEYTRALLRTTYWDKTTNSPKHKTIANLGECSFEEITAIKLALQHKDNLAALINSADIELQQGLHVGAISVLDQIAKRLGIKKSLQDVLQNKYYVNIALWLIYARIIYQGSRLSAFKMSKSHDLETILGSKPEKLEDVYKTLSLLSDNMVKIEQNLFRARKKKARLYLYDVTSSYLEGEHNEYANYGYNRDKKSGKKQIVIGLLADEDGIPIASRVFEGNTLDQLTVEEQINILANNLGVKDIVLVGDRGMLKSTQIDKLPDNFKYITAITKPQIMKLIDDKVFEYTLFDEDINEVECDGARYILRKNPFRVMEIRGTRQSKHEKLNQLVLEQNEYLMQHSKAKLEVALKKIATKKDKLKLDYVEIKVEERVITIKINTELLKQEELLDGCYCIKTDISKNECGKEIIHDRYKNLAQVEHAFKMMKTEHLEIRPIYVRKKSSTNAHVFITTLAYTILKELDSYWKASDYTVEQAISLINSITYQEIKVPNHKSSILKIPKPSQEIEQLLKLANVVLPVSRKCGSAH